MNSQQNEIRFQPDGIRISVGNGTTILEAAQRAGIVLNSFCGGVGTCDKCLVELQSQAKPVKACQYHITGDLVVTIPDSSRFFEQKILEEGITGTAKLDPSVRKHYLELTPPSLDDLRSDDRRLIDAVHESAKQSVEAVEPDISVEADQIDATGKSGAVGKSCERDEIALTIDRDLLGKLPGVLRENNFQVTAVCNDDRVFAVEPGDTSGELFGVAVDVGTTTVVANLVDLNSGKTVAVASGTNPQVTYGDDVISRIQHSRDKPDGLEQLHRQIIGCLNELVRETSQKAGIAAEAVYELVAAGNATMQHLVLGVPVVQIAEAPYVSAFSAAINASAQQLGLKINPHGNVYVMPSVAAHVGGDTVAVTLSAAMRHSSSINMALDIGTNGEIVLGNRDRLLTCSTAAGPAFEGARIRQGMRGATGAIERVHINDDVEIAVIGGGQAAGICGSGLIDALAELLNAGVIEPSGKLLSGDDLPENIPATIRRRVIEVEGRPAFVLAEKDQAKQDEPITLTQKDIREVQLGKGAIYAGMVTLMHVLEIEPDQISRLYLAGAFGNYIRPESARRIGLLPNIELSRIQPIGNAAGTGAREVLLSRLARKHAKELSVEMEYVELAGRADFQDIFGSSMMFPKP
ncbi:MAG: DUF4445 domain-containing protein [Sedimentisphaerales bacterium]|nr:DUF4445 domain-containing protein [Sedimentisphaerales bacterium]